jgi:hypothetical protein
MILITSAAYVNSEFQIEFGRIPPAFLPVGNQKLFQHQFQAIRKVFKSEAVYLSLPETFELNICDQKTLDQNNITIVRCCDKLSLGQSISDVLKSILVKPHLEPLRILHGDTLILDLPTTENIIGIASSKDDYQWEVDGEKNKKETVWCGFFTFKTPQILARVLELCPNFVEAVRQYNQVENLYRSMIHEWLDFGHINTYFQSRAKITTQRSFNSLLVADGCVRKSGTPYSKIAAETEWYRNLPTNFKRFSPQLIDFADDNNGAAFYITEYLPVPPLNEIYVHGRNSLLYWRNVLAVCLEYLSLCERFELSCEKKSAVAVDYLRLAESKTFTRLENFFGKNRYLRGDLSMQINGKLVPSINSIISDCLQRLQNQKSVPGLLHGDFCFSNILFDSRSGSIKVIDPRGLNSLSEQTNLGDIRYDVAKLTHSVIGLYDFIIAGFFECSFEVDSSKAKFDLLIYNDKRISNIQEDFLNHNMGTQLSVFDSMPMVVLLFLSMLPLHSDNKARQNALLANALRVYVNYLK